LVLVLAGNSASAQPYPNKPVTIVSPLPPGGTTDLAARTLATVLEQRLKQPFVVDNKPGGAGAIGAALVANARPDGYTLLVTQASVMLIPEVDKALNRTPAYAFSKLEPLARLTADPVIVGVRKESPFQRIDDLVAELKKRPGQLSYSSNGAYGTTHIPMEMFLRASGLRMRHVPTTGGGPAVTAMLGGHVDVGLMAVSGAVSQMKAGAARALLNISDERSPGLPDVPHSGEYGAPVKFRQWVAVFAPAGTPAPILAQLDMAISAAVNDEIFKKALANVSTPIEHLARAAFKSYLQGQAAVISDTVNAIAATTPAPR
jgi:tripartite-type tricarboxylate transporter receptor subunit TctC